MYETIPTAGMTRGEWLRLRKNGIGGSDAGAVCGLNPYSSPMNVYRDKTTDETDDTDSESMRQGRDLEDYVAQRFTEATGLKVRRSNKMYRSVEYPFMLADVDYFIEFADGTTGILECKTTNYNCQNKWSNDSVPVNYEYQGRHYMAVLNLDKVYFACLYGNNESEFIIRCVERDLDIEEDLIAEEEYFWKEYVEKGVEPPYTEKPDLVLESIRRHCGPAEKDADQVNLDRKHVVELERYLQLKEEKARHESEVKKLDGLMKEAYAGIVEDMGVSCTGVLKDGQVEYLVSYNPAYRTGIDKKGLERLKIQFPDVYDDYVNTTESRRFSVKKKGAA